MEMSYRLDDMLKSKISNNDEEIRVVFKKTINTGKYETEVYEAESTVHVSGGITGIERNIITAVLMSELQYGILMKLVSYGKYPKDTMVAEMNASEYHIKVLYDKAKALGIDTSKIDKYVNGME